MCGKDGWGIKACGSAADLIHPRDKPVGVCDPGSGFNRDKPVGVCDPGSGFNRDKPVGVCDPASDPHDLASWVKKFNLANRDRFHARFPIIPPPDPPEASCQARRGRGTVSR